jgi:hypothetical protein
LEHERGHFLAGQSIVADFCGAGSGSDCIDVGSASGAEQDLFTSLEGLVNRTQPQIACVSSAPQTKQKIIKRWIFTAESV